MAFSQKSRGSTFSTTCNTSSNQQTTQSNEQWQSGMSPFPYEIVLPPNNVRKCYGCGNDFAEKYRKPPFNLIVKHVDRRIIKKCEQTGRLVFSHDYNNTLVFSQLHVHQLLYIFICSLLLHCYIHTNYHITIMCMHINHFHVNQQNPNYLIE